MEDKKIFDNSLQDDDNDLSLRPQVLAEYVGQKDLKELLNIFIHTAKLRNETLDHVLLYGPPGLGKTTLAHIIANEMGSTIHSVTAPSIDRIGDLAAILSTLEAGDVLFIDEIHRLPKIVEEVLYSAMEDYVIDIIVGKDATASSIKIDLPPFTLIGATTRCGDVSAPLRDRFGIVNQINYYNNQELQEIVKRTSKVFKFTIDDDASLEIAKRSRGTPRIANRLFRRVRDFAQFYDKDTNNIVLDIVKESLEKLEIDEIGLTQTDRKYLISLIERFSGGPAGINAIAASIGEDIVTIEDFYEPYLLQEGFISRTPRGRIITEKGYDHLGIKK
ncbi:MAG: Holliday junction branch migration DNA helicase RuvB [Bacilli bacterium]|jgi:Holliday junction DNA helicase RuvB